MTGEREPKSSLRERTVLLFPLVSPTLCLQWAHTEHSPLLLFPFFSFPSIFPFSFPFTYNLNHPTLQPSPYASPNGSTKCRTPWHGRRDEPVLVCQWKASDCWNCYPSQLSQTTCLILFLCKATSHCKIMFFFILSCSCWSSPWRLNYHLLPLSLGHRDSPTLWAVAPPQDTRSCCYNPEFTACLGLLVLRSKALCENSSVPPRHSLW